MSLSGNQYPVLRVKIVRRLIVKKIAGVKILCDYCNNLLKYNNYRACMQVMQRKQYNGHELFIQQ